MLLPQKKIDPTHSSSLNYYGNKHPSEIFGECTADLSLTGHIYEQGWVTNSAGYDFNNFYGFGLVDGKAAVAAAKVYVSNLGTQVELNSSFTNVTYRESPSLAIPDEDKDGVTDIMNVNHGVNLKVESVQLRILITHPKSGEIGLELTSPSGTKSILMNINNSFLFENDSNLDIVLTSNAFYGENSNGNWMLKVIDGRSSSTGTLDQWNLNILGH